MYPLLSVVLSYKHLNSLIFGRKSRYSTLGVWYVWEIQRNCSVNYTNVSIFRLAIVPLIWWDWLCMDRDGEIRAFMEWRKIFLHSLMFLEKQWMYLLCSHLLKRLVKLPPESRGKWLDPKANLGFYTIVKNVNKQYALISLKYLSSNNSILSTHSVCSFT